MILLYETTQADILIEQHSNNNFQDIMPVSRTDDPGSFRQGSIQESSAIEIAPQGLINVDFSSSKSMPYAHTPYPNAVENDSSLEVGINFAASEIQSKMMTHHLSIGGGTVKPVSIVASNAMIIIQLAIFLAKDGKYLIGKSTELISKSVKDSTTFFVAKLAVHYIFENNSNPPLSGKEKSNNFEYSSKLESLMTDKVSDNDFVKAWNQNDYSDSRGTTTSHNDNAHDYNTNDAVQSENAGSGNDNEGGGSNRN